MHSMFARFFAPALFAFLAGGLPSPVVAATNIVSGVYSNVGGIYQAGGSGSSDLLIVTNAGWFENTSGILGYASDAGPNVAFVGGANSLWDNKGELFIGQAGSGNLLVITNGGRVNSSVGYLGYESGSGHNSALVQGPGAVWSSGGGLHVGFSGSGNHLTLASGGRLYSGGVSTVGYHEPSGRNTMLVTGAGTFWFGGDEIAVGFYGASQNELTISSGAQVYGVVGYLGNGMENVAVVTGPGSLWNNIGTFYLGNEGWSNRLVVADGGRIVSSGGIISGSYNQALVSGLNSVWETGGEETQLVIGAYGTSNLLAIASGGRVNSRTGILTGDSNTVQLAGPGALWNNRETLHLGEEFGLRNQLGISDSARVASGAVTLGGDEGMLSVRGAGSWLNSTGTVCVGGELGAGNRLNLAEGGRITSSAGYIGGAESSFYSGRNNGNSATVSGTGSVWESGARMVVGSTGSGNQLAISDAGQVRSTNGYLGFSGAGANNLVTVTGTDSLWDNAQDLFVGYAGSDNRLVVTNRGRVNSANGRIGRNNNRNNRVVVTGSGALWNIRDHLQVGNSGSDNGLTIAAGGRVNSTTGSIDAPTATPNAKNNFVLVTGAGSLWANSGALSVGGSSSFNRLSIEQGGMVRASSLQVGNSDLSYNNTLTISGGSLFATNGLGLGTLEVLAGTATLDGGEITVDRLVVASGSRGVFNFDQGVLATKATTVANDRIFTVGSGAIATLNLQGGTHSFADGLSVLPGSALSAAGAIYGNLSIAGSLLVGRPTGSLTINGNLRCSESASLGLTIGGPNRGRDHDFVIVTNFLQFGGQLNLSLINGFVPASNSVFTLIQFGQGEGSFLNVASGTRIAFQDSAVSARVDYSGSSLQLSEFENALPAMNEIDPAWAIRYFGHSPLSNLEKEADADHDGMSNRDEYSAGTDPLDASSVLKIIAVSANQAGHPLIRFQSITNKSYSIVYSDDLHSWRVVTAPTLTRLEENVAEWEDDGTETGGLPRAGEKRFYRATLPSGSVQK